MKLQKLMISRKILTAMVLGITIFGYCGTQVSAEEEIVEETIVGQTVEFGEKDAYDFNDAEQTDETSEAFSLCGEISRSSEEDGITHYMVKNDNLKLGMNKDYANALLADADASEWHIVNDKSKTVDATKLEESIGSGAVIIQTSKDGKTWINESTVTDVFDDVDKIDKKVKYETTDIQLANGCYYRVIIAYKMERETAPTKIWKYKKKNYEYKECAEVYEFYACYEDIDLTEKLSTADAYQFGDDVKRTKKFEGYAGEKEIENEDPHNGWKMGHFYVSGYTGEKSVEGDTVFFKETGDTVSLWFNLEQDINKCNGKTSIKVSADSTGSDQYFGTETTDFGHGALIIRKTDYQNKNETQIYTNFLEASATTGANTRVDLFEEGDYEIALDYQLTYDKTKLLGKFLPKTLHYRIFFTFKVRNGDCKLFLRDAETGQFLNNANIAENGFYIDLAKSRYLDLLVTRDVMTDSLDGLVKDTKFNGVAKEGRKYTDEGVYTITATNSFSGAKTEKKIYVGDSDILNAYVSTGLTIDEIKEKIAAGSYVDENGNIVDSETNEVIVAAKTAEIDSSVETSEEKTNSEISGSTKQEAESNELDNNRDVQPGAIVIIAIVILLVAFMVKKKQK